MHKTAVRLAHKGAMVSNGWANPALIDLVMLPSSCRGFTSGRECSLCSEQVFAIAEKSDYCMLSVEWAWLKYTLVQLWDQGSNADENIVC